MTLRNPISGRNCTGFRFRFHAPAISRRILYLPLEMKRLPQIQLLMHEESPLSVFNRHSIESAKHAFNELRKKYDFDYWAANEYTVRDINDADSIIPLRLNDCQHYVIDIIRRRYFLHRQSRYIITKSFRRVGLTSCIQAYILWMQTYHPANSITCAPSEGVMDLMKANVSRYIRKDGGRYRIFLHGNMASAFFQSPYTPHVLDRVTAGFVHLADMAQWLDRSSETTHHIISNALNGWVRRVPALFILEGDRPSDPRFRMEDHRNHHIPELIRLMRLSDFCDNPLFLSKVVTACDLGVSSDYQYIDLDKAP